MINNKGITLISLMVTIILLIILTGVGLNISYIGVKNVKDSKLNTELGIVRQAVIQQYSKAKAVGQVKKMPSEAQLSFWVGERIQDFSEIDLPEKSSINQKDEVDQFYDRKNNYTCDYQEDYYYRLTPETLNQLGITNAKHTYIVNYRTGEVYNETKKVDSVSNLLYSPTTVYTNETSHTGDEESFNDWEKSK